MKTMKTLLFIGLISISQLSFAGPNEDLVTAIKEKNTEKLKAALDAGADVNQTFEHTLVNWHLGAYQKFKKFTPLMLASYNGYYDGVLYLLHNNVKANAKANGGVGAWFNKFPISGVKSVTALHLAAGNGHVDIVKLFIQAKVHKTLVIMEVKAKTSFGSKQYLDFVNGVAHYTPKKWAKTCGHEDIAELWKESKKAAWAKEGLPKIN